MASTDKIAKNLRRFKEAINAHDRENPTHSPAHGIGVAHFDLERLGFDEGEELWPGVSIFSDRGCTGNFRILCDGDHSDDAQTVAEMENLAAVGIVEESRYAA